MIEFGDYDPDDAWDSSDNVIEQLRVIGNRVAWLIEHRDDLHDRVGRLVDDIGFVRRRIIQGDV